MTSTIETLFSAEGRMRRLPYALWMAAITFAMIVVAVPVAVDVGLCVVNGSPPPLFAVAIGSAAFLIGSWSSCIITVKRLHDIGLPGWWTVILGLLQTGQVLPLLPLPGASTLGIAMQLASFVAGIVVAAVPGSSDSNEYGPTPA